MKALPLTVIGGYLGAGKTTLINRILSGDHGLRILVLVNDFGSINIDASLLVSEDQDTIELSNGCVCCTMGADLFLAVGDVLDRKPRPDHLIIEASGIADPAKIANVAQAEPDLRYAGIVTVVDGENYSALAKDPQIGPQVIEQVSVADILALSKTPISDTDVSAKAPQILMSADEADKILTLVRELPETAIPSAGQTDQHPDYEQWSTVDTPPMDIQNLQSKLASRPTGVFRGKGLVPSPNGFWEFHIVGSRVDIVPRKTADLTGVVFIGLKGAVEADHIATWWSSVS